MKILNLIIKQVFFDQILAGEKKQEFREIKPTTEKKYILLDDDRYPILDENNNCIPVHYDAIRFFVGYKPDRDSALVEVKDAHTEVIVDENDQPLMYLLDDGTEYWVEQIVYDLGKIIEKKCKII